VGFRARSPTAFDGSARSFEEARVGGKTYYFTPSGFLYCKFVLIAPRVWAKLTGSGTTRRWGHAFRFSLALLSAR
jgi:hypothetical protein